MLLKTFIYEFYLFVIKKEKYVFFRILMTENIFYDFTKEKMI